MQRYPTRQLGTANVRVMETAVEGPALQEPVGERGHEQVQEQVVDELSVDELLVEEISIDGMCGVY